MSHTWTLPRWIPAMLAGVVLAAAFVAYARTPRASAQGAATPSGVFQDATLTIVGTAEDGLDVPRDLAFHNMEGRTNELWTVNRATDGTVIWHGPMSENPRTVAQVDGFANHFMEEVSSIAFGADGDFATCQESRNTYNGRGRPNDFMGPTLWDGDPRIYATVNQPRPDATLLELAALVEGALCSPLDPDGPPRPKTNRRSGVDGVQQQLLGSHIDMLHQSPDCMGIEHHAGNGYWVTDGHNEHVVFYDFKIDHGPGGDDHSDGIVRRYPDAPFTRVPDVPGHMARDWASDWLYYADTGEGVVRRIDVTSGRVVSNLPPRNEPLAEFSAMGGVTVEEFAADFVQPAGIAVHATANLLLVGDHATGDLVALDLDTGAERGRLATGAEGLMGIEVDPEGRVWFVDGAGNHVVRIETDPAAWPSEPNEPPTAEPTAEPTEEPTAVPSTLTPEPTATPDPTATPEPTRWFAWLPHLLRR